MGYHGTPLMGEEETLTMHQTLFISDIHLQQSREDITTCFLNFLNTEATKADAVYILGDLFEFWVGDDDDTPFHETILSAIKSLSTKVPVYFIRGNRDFLIGDVFAQKTGCVILDDPTVVNLYGKYILLSHGDLLCTDDVEHQKFRNLSQNPKYNRFFFWLPLFIRKWIAGIIRDRSQGHMQKIDLSIMDVTQDTVIQIMKDNKVGVMIHGHTHRPDIHKFTIENQPATRIVLGDWHKAGSVLVFNEDGLYSLKAC